MVNEDLLASLRLNNQRIYETTTKKLLSVLFTTETQSTQSNGDRPVTLTLLRGLGASAVNYPNTLMEVS